MSDLSTYRRAVALVLGDAEASVPSEHAVSVPSEHVALILLALDSLHLLRDLNEEPEAYVARVREMSLVALERVARRQRLRVVEPPDDAA